MKNEHEHTKSNNNKKHTQQLLFSALPLIQVHDVSFCFDNEHQERRKTMKKYGDYKYL